MSLTEYERDMFSNLDTLSVDSGWYNIKSDRKDRDRFIEAIKRRIDYGNDFEFNEDYSKFRRIEPFSIPRSNNITYTIEWHEDTGQQTEKEKNLPDPEWKSYTKSQWDKLMGRKN